MTAAAVDRSGRALSRLDDHARRSARTAVILAVLAGACVAFSLALSIGLAAAASVQALAALGAYQRRRQLIAQLALEPHAYEITAVRAYGEGLAGRPQRERLGRWLTEVLDDAGHPASLYLADRVAAHREEITELARELMSPDTRVAPVSAATCRRLLTAGTDSPLYNPHLPASDLASTLFRIRSGITASSM